MRYFTHIRSLPQKVLKRFSDIDYHKDMALVALYPPKKTQQEIVGIGQWIIDERGGMPELALQVRDDWQGQGLGKFLFLRLIEMAKSYKILKLKADVLSDNKAMTLVFESAGIHYHKKTEIGVCSYVFDLSQKNKH
jgi:acetyltransferase